MLGLCTGSVGLFFLGHMAWAYVWTEAFKRKFAGKLFIPAILTLGVIPDVDLFLGGIGTAHRTLVHSLFFWFVIFAPFLVVFRGKSIPYLVAVVQHFAFGDLLVGSVMIFWPFSTLYFGANIQMPSVLDTALETAGFLLAAGTIYFNGDLRRLLSAETHNILMFLPLLALLASMLFLAVDWPVIPLIAYIGSRKLLTAIVLGHLTLATFLAASAIQGFRGLFNNRRR
jgi:hypothetical protein